MNVLFIHHSCGGRLLATPGGHLGGERGSDERCIYQTHPDGGGLRELLTDRGYAVNQASFGSIVGDQTDFCHWRQKFAMQMDRVLRTQKQNHLLPEGERNRVVCFKSDYTNCELIGRGTEPGDADDSERTLANAKAAYQALLPSFREQPDVLFLAMTPPPLAVREPRNLAEQVTLRFTDRTRGGELAREFATWLTDPASGWLAGYDLPNVAVFDYWRVLTGNGSSTNLAYRSEPNNHHPTSEGNQKAAAAFLEVFEAAVARTGLSVG